MKINRKRGTKSVLDESKTRRSVHGTNYINRSQFIFEMIAFVDHVDSSAEISSIVSVFSIVQVTEGNWVNEAFQELHNHQRYRFDLMHYF